MSSSERQFGESSSLNEAAQDQNNIGAFSNLQANAPEFYPPNTSQGAVKKRPLGHNGEFQNKVRANTKVNAQYSNSSYNYNSKRRIPKNFNSKDRNYQDHNNWRRGEFHQEDSGHNFQPQYSNYHRQNTERYSGRWNQGYQERADNHYENFYSPHNGDYTGNSQQSQPYDFKYKNNYKNKPNFERRNGAKYYPKHNQLDRNLDQRDLGREMTSNGHKHNMGLYDKKKRNFNYTNTTQKNDSMIGQRERLIEMINSRLLECLVCCEKIKRTDKVWSCLQCYHIIHLECIMAWANSSKVENQWRCPACQNLYSEIPNQYTCYCGQTTNPKLFPNIIPHGCDNMCLRKGKNCDHKCSKLCHPGPCPECTIMVSKSCGCGKTQQVVKCSGDIKVTCSSICDKVLNCGIHKCSNSCHVAPCPPCSEEIIQECHCGKSGRKVLCDKDTNGQKEFACENNCDKLLPCGNHKCEQKCHPGLCTPCEHDVNLIKSCFCGKTPLENQRNSCLDPIPCCDKICGKTLICGPPSTPHTCQQKCHSGKCPPCPLTTVIRCRCGNMDKEVACQKLTTKADDARCEKKCTKRRLCGKHTCKQKCCIEIEHICPLPCNHMLSCGLHRCEMTCHSGRCPPCMETSFEELYCECGASVLYPPVPCGTKRPICHRPCSKPRSCGHPANHDCHPGPCPPCFVLTKQWCFNKHEQRAAIPCNQKSFSCGLPCGNPMPCGRHKCTKPCHEDNCPFPCIQPCSVPRALCGHPCNKPCHSPPCPESPCKQIVPITCLCGLQKSTKICMDLSDEYRTLELAQIREKMGSMSMNQTFDISDTVVKKPSILKVLECNDECKILERNRRLAIGLQIQNPDLSQKLTPRYSDYLKQWAKKDPKFCQRIHEKLSELVQLAKQSKQKSRSYSFESMNRDKRHFIHEYCEYFGMESAAYDAEPNRNVIATAIKDKSWLPSMSLLEVLQRENGQRKVPGPVLGYTTSSKDSPESVSLKLLSSTK